MTDTSFRPTLYLLDICPFCFKVQMFLAETGRSGDFNIVSVSEDSPEKSSVREKLSQHFEKVTFPTVETAPGQFLNESDTIIAHFAGETDVNSLPAYALYEKTILPELNRLWKENLEMKSRQHNDQSR